MPNADRVSASYTKMFCGRQVIRQAKSASPEAMTNWSSCAAMPVVNTTSEMYICAASGAVSAGLGVMIAV